MNLSPTNILLLILICSCQTNKENQSQPAFNSSPFDLHYDSLPTSWDEGIPLGNGMIGALVWKKEGKLRLSLDRADLWDLRPMENLRTSEWKYSWVYNQWKKDEYIPVQKRFDEPYDKSPAPSKIPGAALEFDISGMGPIQSAHLYVHDAVCEILWMSGVSLQIFVHATDAVGWYRFDGLTNPLEVDLLPPAYQVAGENADENPVSGQDLRRLGYPQGKVIHKGQAMTYNQQGWGDFRYQVHADQKFHSQVIEGCWSISSLAQEQPVLEAKKVVDKNLEVGLEVSRNSHLAWWKTFWSKSGIEVPNKVLQKQWYLEQYKFGSAARVGAPPISLQAVWTADNGKLPPWKGDFHHDLNTQLSYWPAYSANHLEEETGFIEWLWKYRETFATYTRTYFESKGINVPGVTTLAGEPMGGWIQYSFGPTVSAWLAQHFYLHWQYTMDREFLQEKAYPWIKDVAVFLQDVSEKDSEGKRKLPISSSPEIHDNSREAWFEKTTNFDLALIRWTYEKAAELAAELGQTEEAASWKSNLSEWPDLAIDAASGLMIAPDLSYQESHRHFSHQMAYHPLGLIDFSHGESDQKIIENTIATLEKIGTAGWVGYSFSWLANLKARAFDGEGAENALDIFATSFCLANSFHVNGDQSGKGFSNFTYRPFTLEGNFAFAAGLQEMLIQSHSGVAHLFPAVPADWLDISFEQLRTVGAFLVSAKRESGAVTQVKIKSTSGGILKLKNPFKNNDFDCSHTYQMDPENILHFQTARGDEIELKSK